MARSALDWLRLVMRESERVTHRKDNSLVCLWSIFCLGNFLLTRSIAIYQDEVVLGDLAKRGRGSEAWLYDGLWSGDSCLQDLLLLHWLGGLMRHMFLRTAALIGFTTPDSQQVLS